MRTTRWGMLVFGLLAAVPAVHAEQKYFIVRDKVAPAATYYDGDGGVIAPKPADSDWVLFDGDYEPPADEFMLPGPFPILQTAPALQTFVFGPSFRNQKNRIETGAGLGYVNAKYRFPFEFSVEPTYRRNKRVQEGKRHFRRVRTFGLLELWNHATEWGSTSFAPTIFYDWQEESFDNLEIGGSLSQNIGRRLTVSASFAWAGDWPNGGSFSNAAFGSVGASYNLGAGVRFGGFYEPDNNYTHENDFGGFVSYQVLPFAELVVNAGKNEFVLVRLIFSYALERPAS